MPYLTARILGDAIARPHWNDPYIVVRRAEQRFVQAFYPPDTECVLEYRDGGPDRHYRATTAERSLVQHVIWDWTIDGPAGIQTIMKWDRMDF